jgi:hypothetical protein
MTRIDMLERSISRAVKLIQGGKNYLNWSDAEIIAAYKNTKLDNYAFTNLVSKFCKRSPRSIRAMLAVNDVYRMLDLRVK